LEVIGDASASKLIEGRPYTSLEAARVATGLSKDKWKKIESLVTVE
jgi:DNA uptake protein ComE-like DNA-binding protein